MFSEYASRFLAQSQSRLIGPPLDTTSNSTMNSDRTHRRPAHQAGNTTSSRYGSRYLQRPGMGNPYQAGGSQFARFAFGSRQQQAQAPLFYSATDDFREQDDLEEREREAADYRALQSSRRHFSTEKLEESEEADEEGVSAEEDGPARSKNALSHHYSGGRGIRSSWRGQRRLDRGRPPTVRESLAESPERASSTSATSTSKGKGRLVDVELSSSRRSSLESVNRAEAESAMQDESPPAVQKFKTNPVAGISRAHQPPLEDADVDAIYDERARLHLESPDDDRESVPDLASSLQSDPPKHDPLWGSFFQIALASMFATSVLVYLHTDEPGFNQPLGDTIYTVLHKSFHLLAIDTLVAVIVSAIWLALLRSAIRPLTYLVMVAFPIILFSFSIYGFVSSSKGYWKGQRFQDKAMWFLAFVPLVATGVWIFLTYKARHSIERAMQILEFACKILTASPALIIAGFIAQAVTIVWFWVWLLMFTRVFLEGHWAKSLWVLDQSTWWLGAYFILMLLWTLSVISSLQRATSAATTSQWYFHRNTQPSPSSRQVVLASFQHASSQLFGTICFHTFLTVAIRLPLLILPRRLVTLFTLCIYSIIPSPIAALTNPLTLTYAAIHSQPLAVAARQLTDLSFISRTEATTTLSPNTASAPSSDTLVQYRTAKLILHATRYMMTLAMGFGGWISTARLVQLDTGYRGSLYAYVIGLGAAIVGWSVLGAMEGIVLGVVDASVVCWASDVGSQDRTRGRGLRVYCHEANELFGTTRDEQRWRSDLRV